MKGNDDTVGGTDSEPSTSLRTTWEVGPQGACARRGETAGRLWPWAVRGQ